MGKSRREADDTLVRLEDTQKENSRITNDKEAELEKVIYAHSLIILIQIYQDTLLQNILI